MSLMLLRYSLIFIIAFVLNALWEHAHAVLYVHYKGGPITSPVLLRAALFDASVITLGAIAVALIPALRDRMWLLPVALTIFAVSLEWWALARNRWEYTSAMPIIPFIGTGLTPSVQLGLLGYVALLLAELVIRL